MSGSDFTYTGTTTGSGRNAEFRRGSIRGENIADGWGGGRSITNSEEGSSTNNERRSMTNSRRGSMTNSRRGSMTNSREGSMTNSRRRTMTNSRGGCITNSGGGSVTNSRGGCMTNSRGGSITNSRRRRITGRGCKYHSYSSRLRRTSERVNNRIKERWKRREAPNHKRSISIKAHFRVASDLDSFKSITVRVSGIPENTGSRKSDWKNSS